MLTDLWILLPDWLFFRLVRWFKLEAGLNWIFLDGEELEDAVS